MSNVRADLRPVPASADKWFARRQGMACTSEDEAAFKSWLRSDPAHAAEYQECERLWRIPNALRTQPDLAAEALAVAGLADVKRHRTLTWFATALAAGIAAVTWHLTPVEVASPTSITTARGEQRAIALPDGSTVQLNTDTTFRVLMKESERRVELLRGEAFFNVIKDPERPFIVKVGASEVRVVGTQFSVRENGGKLEVVVKEGTVNVVPDASRTATTEADKVELVRGNRLSYDNGKRILKVAVIDPERSLSWRKGVIELDRTPLDEAVEEVNRYAAIPIVIQDQRLATIKVSGGMKVGDTEAFLYAISDRFEVTVDRRADRIILR